MLAFSCSKRVSSIIWFDLFTTTEFARNSKSNVPGKQSSVALDLKLGLLVCSRIADCRSVAEREFNTVFHNFRRRQNTFGEEVQRNLSFNGRLRCQFELTDRRLVRFNFRSGKRLKVNKYIVELKKRAH